MVNDKYEIRIRYSDTPGDDCFVAQVVEMPGVMAHGSTREEAAREIQVALEGVIEAAAEDGIPLPEPRNVSAVDLGRAGGLKKSSAKAQAARANGKKGGRPTLTGKQIGGKHGIKVPSAGILKKSKKRGLVPA